jgi:hypothetical protein
VTEKQFERTVEHLLALHARAEARMDRAEARMDRADARMDRLDRQLQATANLVRAGVKFVTKVAQNQRQTDLKVNRWIRAMYDAGRNGARRRRRDSIYDGETV